MDEKYKKVVFLCSGNGGNLSFFTELAIFEKPALPFRVVGVITDRACGANMLCNAKRIPNTIVNTKDSVQENLFVQLQEYQPDIVVSNFHTILCKRIIDGPWNSIVNLHYSILPAFGGLIGDRPVANAIKFGSKLTGTTVHMVSEDLDGGRPVVQCAIPLSESDLTTADVMDVVFRAGCISLLRALFLLSRAHEDRVNSIDYISILGHQCLFSGGSRVEHPSLTSNEFWSKIRSQQISS